MGSECNPSKHRYDITMSKRTRKPLKSNMPQAHADLRGEDNLLAKVDEDRKSLKQLINGIANNVEETKEDSENRGRNSLGQHFSEEEKQLQLMRRQNQQGLQAVKLKGIMGRYVKVLSHLIKVKRDSTRTNIRPRKKPVLHLAM
ncbi:hypothetical protein JCGZ_05256 [Jatropha curcas]|uniref:Uncharacterized protein n=1 Tax=Jatropha curcas TaxID=180498 RepID=A0A067JCA4_JATCU|nr:uncharacterized protein LOC105650350 [Jatropha curcas]KDP20373.1 hypothetical protein JCGZ_05256 [Jatropha curcas]